MADRELLPETGRKALQINLDRARHGTFAEIGAGQEVAHWFFRVGGAAGTIAKTISAYDKTFSDAIYGPSERYVSPQRLLEMLDREYALLIERLDESRGADTTFFVFADTVAARSYTRRENFHGWLGVRFQTRPRTPPSQIIIHVCMWDAEAIPQQEALGIIGVNLVHHALYHWEQPERLIGALLDDLTPARMEVDVIEFSGPAFAKLDNRLMSLQLVQQGLTNAAMLTAAGEVISPADVLHDKPVLMERGSHRPVTNLTMDLLAKAHRQFRRALAPDEEPVLVMEMTLHNLMERDQIDHSDFLARAEILGALGYTVMISNYARHYRLAAYLRRYTPKPLALAMGVPAVKALFDESYYTDLEGGILEGVGRLFKSGVTLYVYPFQDPASGTLVTASTLAVAPNLRHLYAHLLENGFLEAITDADHTCLHIFPGDVLAKIQGGDPSWKAMVPATVARIITEREYFGLTRPSTSTTRDPEDGRMGCRGGVS